MARTSKFGIFFLVLTISFWSCHTLRCQVEDGPSEEQLKQVVRVCMRKLGDDSDRNNGEDSYEDSSSDESYDNNRRKSNNTRNGNSGRGNRFARDMDRWQQQNDNSYGNRNQQRYDNRYGNSGNNGFNYGGSDYGNGGFSNGDNNRNFNMTNRNRNDNENDSYDKSCMMQCFFQEMKMTNSEGFPDRHKVERMISQDVRDRDMRNFLLDSIQECFHIVEMERRRDKCVFSKNIVSCLAERAKANCDDYYNETMIF